MWLQDILIVYSLGVAVVICLQRFGVPNLVGFLIAGILAGPHALHLVGDVHRLEALAELGIIILLFTIGVETSLKRLLRLGWVVVGAGLGQILLTAGAAALVGKTLGWPAGMCLAVGFAVTLSSTAIVLKILTDHGEGSTLHGRLALGILVFQDLAVIPMLLIMSAWGAGDSGPLALTMAVGKSGLVLIAVFTTALLIVPRLFAMIVQLRNQELFMLALIASAMGIMWVTHAAGFSLGVGAFLAGLILSDSEYSHHSLSSILPFRDAFSSLFFVSLGMYFDVPVVLSQPALILGGAAAVMVAKALIVFGIVKALKYSTSTALACGCVLGQIGEFAFVLLETGKTSGLLTDPQVSGMVAVSVLTMGLTPLLFSGVPLLQRVFGGAVSGDVEGDGHARAGHVILVGFGVCGRNTAKALKEVGVPYVILEMNPTTVRTLRAAGEDVFYGDATHAHALEHAGLANARALVVTPPEPAAARRIIQAARAANATLPIIGRTRFVSEAPELLRLGASEVVPEELETSVQIVARVLRAFLVPQDILEHIVRQTRAGDYGIFLEEDAGHPLAEFKQYLTDVRVEVVHVQPGSPIAGRTLADSKLRESTGALVLGQIRHGKLQTTLNATDTLNEGDVFMIAASAEDLPKATTFFKPLPLQA